MTGAPFYVNSAICLPKAIVINVICTKFNFSNLNNRCGQTMYNSITIISLEHFCNPIRKFIITCNGYPVSTILLLVRTFFSIWDMLAWLFFIRWPSSQIIRSGPGRRRFRCISVSENHELEKRVTRTKCIKMIQADFDIRVFDFQVTPFRHFRPKLPLWELKRP